MEIEATPTGYAFLSRRWQTFAHAHGLEGRLTFHFKHDGTATLFVRIFEEDGRRLGCCPEGDGGDSDHLSADDSHRGGGALGGELALGDDRSTSSSSGELKR